MVILDYKISLNNHRAISRLPLRRGDKASLDYHFRIIEKQYAQHSVIENCMVKLVKFSVTSYQPFIGVPEHERLTELLNRVGQRANLAFR